MNMKLIPLILSCLFVSLVALAGDAPLTCEQVAVLVGKNGTLRAPNGATLYTASTSGDRTVIRSANGATAAISGRIESSTLLTISLRTNEIPRRGGARFLTAKGPRTFAYSQPGRNVGRRRASNSGLPGTRIRRASHSTRGPSAQIARLPRSTVSVSLAA